MERLSLNLTHQNYDVAILCALRTELLAVRTLFEEEHHQLKTVQQDTNHYSLGRMGEHYVVATCLPSGEYGTNAASAVMVNMQRSFPQVECILLVGIGGGVPSSENDIRLGDVVVSHPNGSHPAVKQYDMGKILENGMFQSTGILQQPPRLLMTAISSLISNPNSEANSLQQYLKITEKKRPEFRFPGQDKDILFAPDSPHTTIGDNCHCCEGQITNRIERSSDQPHIFFGPIGSGNQVMRSAKQRDILGENYGMLCFEMEAAGVMNLAPCLVIRGICDYADSHKNKAWQQYAAATAAAYARLFLSVMRSHIDTNKDQNISCTPMTSAPRDRAPVSATRNLETLEAIPYSTESLNFANSEPVRDESNKAVFEQPAFLRTLQPAQDPEQVLQKVLSFTKRDPSWNPWPNDRGSDRLFQSLSRWLIDPSYPMLTIRGTYARSSFELPAPDNFACHAIHFLRKTTLFPIIWIFSTSRERHSARDGLKAFISQALDILDDIPSPGKFGLTQPMDEEPDEEQLFEILAHILCVLPECFIMIEIKHAPLAERFRDSLQRVIDEPGANFKAIIICYDAFWKDSHGRTTPSAIMPSIKLRGSQPGWDSCWDRLKPRFK
ncbi:uncharacterized protein N7503_004553 [Penicillium pulvis]|uniref:uncharacterized protein n=1 Tax=Penicillium pulvis TaxID=1562058 RepID=UPI0025481AD9|nr:uncharacterized protein N7503_004553 [Penicillium pulvis]KAJ5802103.1 hypothetical protein N7503_004553 [Penicillium pulvis]